ncbi:MAG: hypothetical protein ACRDY1_06115 [Acidimicrobiales bacterium]
MTAGWRLACSTVFGSSGHPGASVVKPAASNRARHRSQLVGNNHRA